MQAVRVVTTIVGGRLMWLADLSIVSATTRVPTVSVSQDTSGWPRQS